ncbi:MULTISPECIES: DUF3465 domain-containing protein [Methylotenera]|uniref:DUF3465 domain-containing protein n=1 Tax=Methylotenera TaxID=359407 RepID=UPI000363F2BD|nr:MULTISPECIES: DUF3465 domain-containing protein [Methylotenera]
MMRLLLIIAIAVGFTAHHFGYIGHDGVANERTTSAVSQHLQQSGDSGGEQIIRKAFENHASNLQVEASGKVIKVLDDDTNPPRHQRFILKLDNGISLLVAHNIDLAKRVENLQAGDIVSFSGEYEWNKKGGVLHWTHHDPQGRHAAGWLQHNGQTYQ